jgi:hypothetical protein
MGLLTGIENLRTGGYGTLDGQACRVVLLESLRNKPVPELGKQGESSVGRKHIWRGYGSRSSAILSGFYGIGIIANGPGMKYSSSATSRVNPRETRLAVVIWL